MVFNGSTEVRSARKNAQAERLKHNLFGFFLVILGNTFFLAISLSSFAAETRVNWVVRGFEKNRDAVVNIQGDKVDEYSSSSKESGKSYNGMGTGIIIDERGYIVTNFHVVEGIRKIQVTTYDRRQHVASLVARDTDTDLAVIKINPRKPLKTITFGRSDDLMPGELCMAIGNPYGYTFSVTDGRISGVGREVEVNDSLLYKDAIQTSTPINPGNSGGPLINVHGEMIGINAAIRQGAECIAFAIPVDQVVDVAAKLIRDLAERTVYHGLKVSQTEFDSNSDSGLRWGEQGGRSYSVVVTSIDSNSPAATAGLREGDIVKTIGNYTIANTLDFYRALLDLKIRDDLSFGVLRDSEHHDIAITLGSPREEALARNSKSRVGAPSRASALPKTASQAKTNNLDEMVWENIGIRYTPMPLEDYRRAFAQYLNEHPRGGVVVKAVREGSQLAEKGVMPGDVIVGIHEWVTTSLNDVRYIAKAWPTIKTSDNKVQILLFRDGVPYFTEVPLER